MKFSISSSAMSNYVNTHAAFIYLFYYKNLYKHRTFIIFWAMVSTLILVNEILHNKPMIVPSLREALST